ncbi:hypothetical protein AVEN_127573-1 [Araneus ventricosus]|uniref:Uncharacterized protein n=1 Tax=Araneus ventricosus TaxID=182803 RepID=A0A4Y2P8U6_ARAVE|nr:hypothetical protein AVEN_127573-1 [Araneus ventricosus]
MQSCSHILNCSVGFRKIIPSQRIKLPQSAVNIVKHRIGYHGSVRHIVLESLLWRGIIVLFEMTVSMGGQNGLVVKSRFETGRSTLEKRFLRRITLHLSLVRDKSVLQCLITGVKRKVWRG